MSRQTAVGCWTRTARELEGLDEIHDWLSAAYQARVEQALQGEPMQGLPDELVVELDAMDRMNRFKIDAPAVGLSCAGAACAS